MIGMHSMNYQDLITACQQDWNCYTQHNFVTQLAAGTLPHQAYLHYLKQDFLFLKHYARAYALAIYKADNLADMKQTLPGLQALIEHEMDHHVSYCGQWGLTASTMEDEPEDVGTVAYTRYVLETGLRGDLIDLFVALAPCAIGYAEIGEHLMSSPTTNKTHNPYLSWIELYGGADFQQGGSKSRQRLNDQLKDIALDSPKGQRLCKIFKTATRMEVGFWQQALDL